MKTKTSDAWPGDVLCWNKSTNDWEVYHVTERITSEEFEEDGYTWTETTLKEKFDSWDNNLVPDAVCVIPACHTDNNKARWLSLNEIKKSGGYNWSNVCNLVNDLLCYNYIARTSINNITQYNTANDYSSEYSSYIPYETINVDNSVNNKNCSISGGWTILSQKTKYDPIGKYEIYYCTSDTEMVSTPTLYKNDEYLIKHEDCFKYFSEYNNVLRDINGQQNTNILIANGIDNFPAAKACVEYSTTYSPAGTWYLPAAGELAYFMSKFTTILHTLYMLSQTNTSWGINVVTKDNNYWSSSQLSINHAWCICPDGEYKSAIIGISKNTGNYMYTCLRPFKQL